MSSPRLPALLSLLTFCVLARVPAFRAGIDPELGRYLWNFSPLFALMLFSGATYRSWFWAGVAPISTYLLGDIAVWIASGDVADAFHPVSVFTYVALAAVVACGWWLRRRERTWGRIGLAAVSASLSFFLITNFGSWFMDSMLPFPTGYDPGLKGLLDSYVAGFAFTRGIDIAAMLLFTGFFFSPVGLALLTRDEVGEAARSRTAGEVTGESA